MMLVNLHPELSTRFVVPIYEFEVITFFSGLKLKFHRGSYSQTIEEHGSIERDSFQDIFLSSTFVSSTLLPVRSALNCRGVFRWREREGHRERSLGMAFAYTSAAATFGINLPARATYGMCCFAGKQITAQKRQKEKINGNEGRRRRVNFLYG